MMKMHLQRTILFILGLFVLTTAFFVPADDALADDVLKETNAFRAVNNLDALQMNEALNNIAQQHSGNMAKGKVAFGHAGFETRNRLAVQAVSGLRATAENVAYGPATAAAVVSLWKNSSGHRKNMLGKYRFIGIGIAADKQGRLYYTQVFGG